MGQIARRALAGRESLQSPVRVVRVAEEFSSDFGSRRLFENSVLFHEGKFV
jgi:hypothetical protein